MNKTPLVLITGLLSNASVFQHQIKNFIPDREVIVIDMNDVDSPDAIIKKIFKLTPQRFALAGHSLGGWAALAFMKIAAEKVTKLCLLNTSPRGPDAQELKSRQTVLNRLENKEFEHIANEITNKFTFNAEAKPTVLKMFLEVGAEALANQTRAMMLREDLLNILPTIKQPTLIIHASEDKRFSLETHKEIEKQMPGAKLAIIDGCGHMSPMEAPQTVTTLMRYWLDYF